MLHLLESQESRLNESDPGQAGRRRLAAKKIYLTLAAVTHAMTDERLQTDRRPAGYQTGLVCCVLKTAQSVTNISQWPRHCGYQAVSQGEARTIQSNDFYFLLIWIVEPSLV